MTAVQFGDAEKAVLKGRMDSIMSKLSDDEKALLAATVLSLQRVIETARDALAAECAEHQKTREAYALLNDTAALDALRFGLLNSFDVTITKDDGTQVLAAKGFIGPVIDHLFRELQE